MTKVVLCLLALSALALAEPSGPFLLREPSLSKTEIVFNYGGNLWIVGREGGDARRLTAGLGGETDAAFSPDGSRIAFTGEYNGNADVYVIPATGGEPLRLTSHPSDDHVVGWTPDGKAILFTSNRYSHYHGMDQLFTVPVEGGFPSALPLPTAEAAAFSPDGTHVAYVPHPQWQAAWKRYRGGQTTPIWIANLEDSGIVKIPRENSNDFNPMWVGHKVYFLSDRNGPVSLFVYDTGTQQVSEALRSDGLDFKSASASSDAIVIEQFGAILLFDLTTQQAKRVNIRVAGDLEQLRPRYVKVEQSRIRNFTLSPTGTRVLMEAWGEIFSVPADKGDIRNLTHSPAVADRDPAWSPDGKWVAYFSDDPGEYELELREQTGLGKVRHITLGSPPSFYYQPVFSPDSKKIAYSDKRLNLWYVDIEKDKSTPKLIDTDYYDGASFTQNWAPDSKWIVYTKQLPNYLHAVYVYSLEQGKAYQITDGMSDALHPVFDKNGKYLYFMASTDTGLAGIGFDMSGDARPVTRSLYVLVLAKDLASPLAPESDEEKVKEEVKAEKQEQSRPSGKNSSAADARKPEEKDKKDKDKDDKKEDQKQEQKPVVVKLDMADIDQRILALPMPAKNYLNLLAGKSGVLFVSEGPEVMPIGADDSPKQILQRFDLSKRKAEKFLEDVNDYAVSFNGEKLLYRKDQQWALTGTEEPPAEGAKPKPGEGPLKLDGMEVYVEPRQMWNQIYRETWRIERDFFYDPHYHGLDLEKIEKKYAPYLENVASREELTYLFEEALGEMTVGHLFVAGGYQRDVQKVKTGLLGADYRLENGRYRVTRVYNGENWNPGLQAPLTQPGVNVQAGDYILAVNGRELHASDEIYSFFEETAGKQVVLRVGPNPDDKESRQVTVIPVDTEERLRRLAW
ncbi:MAG: PD40 domain-containing protein, partial [Acidobacteria bacterium]|nr:PD40 domain-containing protein [Acidobacteriota bacterium]